MKKINIIFIACLIIVSAILSIKGVAFFNLSNAVAQEDLSRVEFLLKVGFSPNKTNPNGYTPLHFAAIAGNEKIAQALIEAKANVDALDGFGSSPIESATSFGHKKLVKVLIKNKATVQSNLIFTASFNGHTEIVELLLRHGLPLNETFPNGETSLHAVAFGDHVEAAKVLLDNGAQINSKNEKGYTPLHSAAFYGAEDVAKLFIENGADLNSKENKGHTPSQVARENGHSNIEKMLKKAKAT